MLWYCVQPVKSGEEGEKEGGGGEGRGKRSHHKTDEYNRHLPQEVMEGTGGEYCNNYITSIFLSLPLPSPLILQGTNPVTESRISLADFNILKVIGRGSYAKVLMVELKSTKRIYAMKVIKKDLVMDEEV